MQHSSSPQAMPLSPPPPPPNFPLSLPSLSGKKKEERWEQSNKRRKSSHNTSMLRWTKARYTRDCTFYNMLIILSMYACVHAHTHTHTHAHTHTQKSRKSSGPLPSQTTPFTTVSSPSPTAVTGPAAPYSLPTKKSKSSASSDAVTPPPTRQDTPLSDSPFEGNIQFQFKKQIISLT